VEEGFIWFLLFMFYTIRLSSSEFYAGGNNCCNNGVVNCHTYNVDKVNRLFFNKQTLFYFFKNGLGLRLYSINGDISAVFVTFEP
jgi:hypothetical protein